jgi:zinc D-Ala-D-Ala carboxypeptidase
VNRTTWAPAGATGRVAATDDEAFGDRFPTQPIAVGPHRGGLVHGGHHRRAPDAWDRRPPPAPRRPPPSRPHHAAAIGGASHHGSPPGAARPARSTILVVIAVVVAAVAGAIGLQSWTAPPRSAVPDAPVRPVPAPDPATPVPQVDDVPRRPPPPGGGDRQGGRDGALGEADGVVPDGVTVFDDDVPAVANLDPALLDALRAAAADAADAGIEFTVNSGWRSAAYQEQLLREAVAEYGSEEEAARWVSTADTSLHVSGDAIDIGPTAAAAWLSENGADHGLCQIYRNEPWHFELRPGAADDGCPPLYADPTHDPRMQK